MKRTSLILVVAVSAAALLAAPFLGMERIPLGVLWGAADERVSDVFWKLRLPRVIIAFLAGAGLSLSGAALQAMFRNPLATPFTLGISSGAALGAAVYFLLGFTFSLPGVSGSAAFAFVGSLAAATLVCGLTQLGGARSAATMLLAGVAVSFFLSAVIMFLQYLSDYSHSFQMVRWLMGGVETVGFDSVWNLTPFVVSGTLILVFLRHELNLLLLGEELAAGRGVDVGRARALIFLATSLMVGGAVSVCGPIGFVGMITPHVCRLLVGADHKRLLPVAMLAGGTFLVVCDLVARTVIAPAELPVGIITSLLGGPF
ncbi:MAG: iron ABC transporter permease, partial [Planctomycetales bacterium]